MRAEVVDDRPPPPLPPRTSFTSLLDGFFFVFAGVAAVWLAWLIFNQSFSFGWAGIGFFLAFWVVLAYLVLPRLHRILTTIYVPDYFIGRTRTSDGLLGDPVNLAFDGEEAALHAAMRAAGWTRADDVTLSSSRRIITSTLTRRSYDEAPVSPLFLFGAKQDFAYQQEVAGNPAKRHHVRFWRTPDGWLLPGGRRVDWLAAGTFDRSVGFSLFTLQVTHKIDADIDVERDHIVQTLIDADPGIRVETLRDFSTGYHSRNGGGDTIRTDGDLPVVRVGLPNAVEPEVPGDASTAAESHAAARSTTAEAMGTGTGTGTGSRSTDRTGTVAKRAAFESPLRLAEREPLRRMPRPTATAFGAALVVLRVLAGVVWIIGVAIQWDQLLLNELGVDAATDADTADAARLALVFVVVLSSAVLLVELLMAFRIWAGGNLSRIAVMLFATFGITGAAVASFNGDAEVTVRTTFVTVALDILVLLALSSRDARAFARQSRRRGRPRRTARRPQAA
ncbi:LssY C-terminal domain-containing protein [Agromyces sp. M3QZ16-3]|uniref:LssY C-terminal domain-containing protein n=1 Tax=Agromyces sp. M3QZ16-3 TaxID=3447585 RepID=UPI003F693DDA